MYNVGDFVVNGNFGVCEITFIGKKEGMEGDYYGISPVFQKGVNIVMRVDGSEKFIRPVMSRERAENVLGYKRKGEYKFRNDKAKLRTGEYRDMLFSLSDVDWAELAVEQKRYSAKSAGSDQYLKTAK